MNTERCPLCYGPVKEFTPWGGNWAIDCPRCTLFVLNSSFAGALEGASEEERGALSLGMRKASAAGEDLYLTPWMVDYYRSLITPASVSARRGKVLRHLAAISPEAGSWVTFPPNDHDLDFDCKTPSALRWIVESLEASGEILRQTKTGDTFLVTHKGWSATDAVPGAFRPGTCFVAMSFEKPKMTAAREAIRASLKDDCEIEPIIIDEVEHVNRIDDEIVGRLRAAQFVVADFTGQRGGVYFEAGFAQGLGRAVIWTCAKEDLSNLHFDTRNYNFIDWTIESDLRERLTKRVRALGLSAKA